jgi:hypothetical protein
MDEPTKYGVIAFNITAMLFQVIFNMGLFGFTFSWAKLAVAVVLGLAVGGGVFALARSKSR